MSWYQSRPAASLKLIEACGVGKQEGIIDVGGGASVLVDFLLDAGFARLAVLDISAVALAYAKERLGARAGECRMVRGRCHRVYLASLFQALA